MLSGMEHEEIIIKANNQEYIINGFEIGINSNLGKVYILAKEED